HIVQQANGIIAQILLIGHIVQANQKNGWLSDQSGKDQSFIYRYLEQQVLDKQPADLQWFLLRSALLPELRPSLCNELLEITDAETYIQELIRRDLFISPGNDGYRYHQFFAQFLRDILARDPELYDSLTRKAARSLVAHERPDQALNLYLGIQAWDEAAHLLQANGQTYYYAGEADRLNDWLKKFPSEILQQHPRLLLLRGQVKSAYLNEIDEAGALYQQARHQFCKRQDWVAVAEVQIYQAAHLRMIGSVEEALTLVNQAMEQLMAYDADDHLLALAIRNRGVIYGTAGNMAIAVSDIQQALEIYEELRFTYQVGQCHHDFGVVLIAQGNIEAAEVHYRQAIKIWEQLGNGSDLANTLNSLGVSYYLSGNYDEALTYFKKSITIATQCNATRRAAFAQSGVGDVYLAKKSLTKALRAYELSNALSREVRIRSLEVYNLVKIGECHYQDLLLEDALRFAGRAKKLAADNDLVFEKGLACLLEGKVCAGWNDYEASFPLFEQALACFVDNHVLERVKVHLWFGYSLLRDRQALAARKQLEEAISLLLTLGELRCGLQSVIQDTQALFYHFLHRIGTPRALRDNIFTLLSQQPNQINFVPPKMQYFAFGHPLLIVNGNRKLFSQRGRIQTLPEFLAYIFIASQNGGCRWDEVSVAMWPNLEKRAASKRFHQYLRRLRDAVFDGPDYILLEGDYYKINPDVYEWSDILTFENLFKRISTLPPDKGIALQLELIDVYRGEFLAGFELGEWGMIYRAHCETRFLSVVKMASDYLLETETPLKALSILYYGLSVNQFREDLHYNVLIAYGQLGLYSELKSHYEALCRSLKCELDALPDPALRQLYSRLSARRNP
ncbi:MAG: tetratricopeptide repeat protein, partial [Anaerolineae bacterium]|nr:tetratricopeptide repeat protein [Anaerolineae bacterium]